MPIQATSSTVVGRKPPGTSASRRLTGMGAALIVLAALAAWSNSFAGAYVFDDTPAIVDNPTIRHLWPLGPILSPGGEGGTVGGRPVVNLSLALNYAISGTAGWSYHALNLLIHVLAGLTLFGIVRRTLQRPAPCRSLLAGDSSRAPRQAPGPEPAGRARSLLQSNALPVAFTVALLWTVHPLQTESVTYVVQRAESLMGLFFLLTLYGFIRGATAGESRVARIAADQGAPPPGRIWFAFSALACLLGMASKEVMASAPLLVLLYDRTFVAGGFREAWRRRKRYYLGLGATWLLLAWLVVRAEDRGGSAGFDTSVAWWAYALTQCRALPHYLRLSLWPHPLVFDYGPGLVRNPLLVAPQGAMLALLLAGTAFALWRRPAVGFLGAWFFVILAPSSSIVPVATQTMAEHRMYLPLAAVVVLAVTGIHRLLGLRSMPVFAALALGLGWATAQRNRDYRSEFALWNAAARDYPANARAHNNLGSIWMKQGNREEAARCFAAALRLQPDYASPHYNLGIILSDSGHPADALPHFEAALRLEPDFADAHVNLGNALLTLERRPEAIRQYEAALQLQPEAADVHVDLGLALVALGRIDEAIRHYQAAVRLQPDLTAAHYALGNLLAQQSRFAEAIEEYRQVLRYDPGHAMARNNLGNALLVTGRVDEAIAEYEEVLRQRPNDASVRENLERAQAMRNAGRPGP